jgi:hypothetical protein
VTSRHLGTSATLRSDCPSLVWEWLPFEMLLIRNAVDCWSGLLDAREVGATGAIVVHGGVDWWMLRSVVVAIAVVATGYIVLVLGVLRLVSDAK